MDISGVVLWVEVWEIIGQLVKRHSNVSCFDGVVKLQVFKSAKARFGAAVSKVEIMGSPLNPYSKATELWAVCLAELISRVTI